VTTLCRFTDSRTTSWLPDPWDKIFGALVAAAFATIAMIYDVCFLHPIQLSMRSPVMPLWNGTFNCPCLRRNSEIDEKCKVYIEPRPYQKAMFNMVAAMTEMAELRSRRKRRVMEIYKDKEVQIFEADNATYYIKPNGNGDVEKVAFEVCFALELSAAEALCHAPCSTNVDLDDTNTGGFAALTPTLLSTVWPTSLLHTLPGSHVLCRSQQTSVRSQCNEPAPTASPGYVSNKLFWCRGTQKSPKR
jgi:hypothetical protein